MKLFLAVLLVVSASSAPVAQGQTAEQEIRGIRGASNRAIVQCDIARFSASLADDFVMVRGSDAFADREAYMAAFTKDFKDPKASVTNGRRRRLRSRRRRRWRQSTGTG
jgi:hypothetical protein